VDRGHPGSLRCRPAERGGGGGWHNALEKAIEHGFPKGHHLIITTDLIDRRRSLYKIISEKGVVIDCAVAERRTPVDKRPRKRCSPTTCKPFWSRPARP